jgi:hypothetical protein
MFVMGAMMKRGSPSGPTSPQTYYFDSYGANNNWLTPDNIVDGDVDTDATAKPPLSFITDTDITLTSNTCPGTDLGTITKVEIRCYGNEDAGGNTVSSWDMTPVLAAGSGEGQDINALNLNNEYGPWYDITTVFNAPGDYEVKFNNTFWTDGVGSWNGSMWVSESASPGSAPHQLALTELGTWVNGYRPSRMRFTNTNDPAGWSPSVNITVKDKSANTILSGTATNPQWEWPITYSGDGASFDIDNVFIEAVDNTDTTFTVTNIEFYVEDWGWIDIVDMDMDIECNYTPNSVGANCTMSIVELRVTFS